MSRTARKTDAKQPNIILVMLDQLAPQSTPVYGHPFVKTPTLSKLAAEGVVFENFYCNAPLCAPSRFSMMAGQRNSRIGAYDNAAEFPAAVPTFAHYLRDLGYRTCLAGKMHFVGPDQLHGFEERATTDVYPGDFGWTPTWDEPERVHWWYHNMLSVVEAGPYDRSLEMDYDEEVAFAANRWLWDAGRSKSRKKNDGRPLFLTVSFTHPHDPYFAPRHLWDLYKDEEIDMPVVPYVPFKKRDPQSQRLWQVYDRGEYKITDQMVRRARRAYYAMVSYCDELVTRALAPLGPLGLEEDTLVIVTGDHGDMLGESGLWYKMTFFERAARVPMILSWPGKLKPRRVKENASLLDLLPTLVEAAGAKKDWSPAVPLDGASLLPLARGEKAEWRDTVYGEYMGEGTFAPLFMIKKGGYKFITCEGDPDQLYHTAKDPHEVTNLAGDPAQAGRLKAFRKEAAARWDSKAIAKAVLESQRARNLVHRANMKGQFTSWDYSPPQTGERAYNRNAGGELYDTDRDARVPYRKEPKKDGAKKR